MCVILQMYKIQCQLFILRVTVYAGGGHSQVKKDQAENFKVPVIVSEFRKSPFGSSSRLSGAWLSVIVILLLFVMQADMLTLLEIPNKYFC